jgi:steroid 5-alpha reductase family enzyme
MSLIQHFKQVVFVVEGVQLGMFMLSFVIQNPTLVDIAWGLIHFLVGTLVLVNNENKELLFTPKNVLGYALLALWFFRISGFLGYYRIWNRHIDPRYTMLAKQRKVNETLYSLFQFFLQGLFVILTSIPVFYVLNENYHQSELQINHYISAIICIVSLYFEGKSDFQLQAYKDDKSTNKPRVFRGGWFAKSRHPNLFFELMFWYSLAVYAVDLNNTTTFFAFLGPLFLTLVIVKLTIPVTTKHMKQSREGYEKEMERTNMLWPF